MHVEALNAARDRGAADIAAIAKAEAGGDSAREAVIAGYLRDNLRYGLGDAEIAGLRRFHELAIEHGVAPGGPPLRFF